MIFDSFHCFVNNLACIDKNLFCVCKFSETKIYKVKLDFYETYMDLSAKVVLVVSKNGGM